MNKERIITASIILCFVVTTLTYAQTVEDYFNSGKAKSNLEDYRGAIQDYTKAIELNPNHTYAYNNRGIAKVELEDYSGAIQDYTKAIELNPNHAYAYYSRGNAKVQLQDYRGAMQDYIKANEINRNKP